MNIGKSIQQLYGFIIQSGVTTYLGLTSSQVMALSTVIIWMFIGFSVLSLLVIIGHHVGFFKVVHTRASRLISSLMIFFGVYLVALILYNVQEEQEDVRSITKGLGYFRMIPQMSIAELALYLVFLLVFIGGSLLVIGLLWVLLRNLPLLIMDNILSNGIFRGLILSIYDLGSGLFWAAILYCLICGALFLIAIPFFIVLAAELDSRRYIIVVRD